ncbi:MAG TPA: gluconate 2-dehydrogenase subunit 3 family protein [Aliidongia sp.]|uniref:gluconate 2-dehydrogenase subunit 3 family protein n=1 Tax=Aliidongia sp. TaxID=1914230 RepID=UPI002DDCDAAE|nr:gluconate 2-dehydrogenase subunit 3 family protein [Aliidongia sp.]HEV2673355.1 gluconate 2-dehydrogenase subunit 3 family protein [Aliidongia sp.]
MTERYPGYDVLSKRWSDSWNEQTRRVIDRRLSAPREASFFTDEEWRTLTAVCERILPQPKDRPPVPLAAYVDQKMAGNMQDGYRYAQMPPQGDAWRRGLAALDGAARETHGAPFHAVRPHEQDALLTLMQQGKLTGPAWGGMPCALFFAHRVLPDITHAYYAHPTSWNEIGFGGPASPRGYVRMGLDRRDPWEAAEAKPGEEEAARRKNDHVG